MPNSQMTIETRLADKGKDYQLADDYKLEIIEQSKNAMCLFLQMEKSFLYIPGTRPEAAAVMCLYKYRMEMAATQKRSGKISGLRSANLC